MCNWAFMRTETRKSRKEWACSWCGESVPKGEEYRAITGVMDGEIETSKMHLECGAASEEWFLDSGEDCYELGCFVRGKPMAKDEERFDGR